MKPAPDRLPTYDDAFRLIMEAAAGCLLPVEGAPLADLLGRVLAEDLHAPTDIPAAANSAMDGYCLRHAEIASATAAAPITLPVAGHIDAGHPLAGLPAGHAAYIATGGLLPDGADTVVKLEDVELLDAPERIAIRSAPPPGTYIRRRGKDMQAGALVLGQGQTLGPFEIGIVASLGRMGVRVRQRPRVALLTSGDELVMPFDEPQPWQVRNANSTLLAAAIRDLGGEPLDLGIVRDDPARAAAALERAAELGDVVITSGGISLGRRDPFTAALQALQVRPLVHGVAIKPGKPLFFGFLGGKPVFGLPGNQASTAVTFHLFARPFLARMQGRRTPDLSAIVLPLGKAIDNRTGRDHFLRGSIVTNGSSSCAEPFPHQDSHLITSLSGAEILIRHPAGTPVLVAGSPVTCLLIR